MKIVIFDLNLPYAITVHKSQGSGFDTVFLILPNPCNLLSRELLYTALTRQKSKVLVFHQGDFAYFRKYISDEYSEMARRLTDLFAEPEIRDVNTRVYDSRYINVSLKGEFMISKSEVIIANQLYNENIDYAYEAAFTGSDGRTIKPDFTIENNDIGVTFYWEHLGLVSDKKYCKKWELKREWYVTQGILSLEDGNLPDSDKVLITTQDNPDNTMGGIDSRDVEAIVRLIKS